MSIPKFVKVDDNTIINLHAIEYINIYETSVSLNFSSRDSIKLENPTAAKLLLLISALEQK